MLVELKAGVLKRLKFLLVVVGRLQGGGFWIGLGRRSRVEPGRFC
jgi:hypothetical protein